jgi:LuxR family maltose regulon positive regulatory protein
VIEAGALRALALAACGQDADAVDTLADVLTLACPQGYVRVFADEGPPMAALLTRLIAAQRVAQAAAGVPLGCLARLQRAFEVGFTRPGPRSGTAPAAVPGLVEQLTSRELEVLTMLAAGRSNQAIAGQLVVTLDTVKKHVSHVLGKLGAANRTEAVTRARELSLIPLTAARYSRRRHRAGPTPSDAGQIRRAARSARRTGGMLRVPGLGRKDCP